MQTPEQVKSKLTELLGREPTCSQLKDGKYMADYFQYNAPALKFVADTEDGALEALLIFLVNRKPEAPAK